MTEQECLAKMVAPGTPRLGKWLGGVIQILVTSSCDKSCFSCTQASQLRRKPWFMTPEQFETAVLSLRGYTGVFGTFGGNPAVSPHFEAYCEILRKHVPYKQRGLWCNAPLGKGAVMRATFNPGVSNLNVHLDKAAFDEFKRDWPECHPVGLTQDSRHSPPFVAMRDVLRKTCPDCGGRGERDRGYINTHACIGGDQFYDLNCQTCGGVKTVYDEARAWDLISRCDINQHWSAMIGVFRGELRAWFCEIAGAQAILHQDEPDYPDTGVRFTDDGYRLDWGDGPKSERHYRTTPWWQLTMEELSPQVRHHCHSCGVPLRGHGQLAQAGDDASEQVSETHAAVYKPKRKNRRVELVTVEEQLGERLELMTKYLQNASK